MYNWIESAIGVVPSGYEWIYGVGVILLFIAFVVMICSPMIIILNIIKRKRR